MLTEKRWRFVDEYDVDGNATAAAIRAGYSEKTAYAAGHRLLREPEVAAELDKRRAERAARADVSAEAVLAELWKIGSSDIRRLFNDSGSIIPLAALDDRAAGAVASVEVVVRPSGEVDNDGNREVEHVHKIKLWDKNAALTQLGRHFNLFSDTLRHTGPDGGPVEVTDTARAARVAALIEQARRRRDDAGE